ncbi:hypothetical protein J7T55_003614 [Diaporthe amygdali]|uniref:uncharacterized protein n=1 Tax=Phomopsis amygdali TaxID=1214568 RepID=UPI0022FEEC09|nr:uncharacterized protein J7T55_003614 [Diaporthe amygdali]KAJ0117197.1 hypothetical protein J7T55_003614 [Diaporthe amygdali]
MAASTPNDVEAFGADLPKDIQEKHNLRERHHQAVPETDHRRRRTMDSGRKLLLALLVCCMLALGFASAHHGRAGCHEDAVVDVEHTSLSSLLTSNSAGSLRELLEKYVPERYRQQDSQYAKRQDGNSTVSAAVTTAVTTVSSASVVATTTVQTTPSSTTAAATTPTSASVQTTVQTVVQTSVQTQDPATATVTATQTPTPSESAASSVCLFFIFTCYLCIFVCNPCLLLLVFLIQCWGDPKFWAIFQCFQHIDWHLIWYVDMIILAYGTLVSCLINITRHYSGHIQGEPDGDLSHKQERNPCVVEEGGYHVHINHARWGYLSRDANLFLLRRR